jgi:murein L,D-transpeptidase YafK
MLYLRPILAILLLCMLGGCMPFSHMRTSGLSSGYTSPPISSIVISKEARRLYLFSGKTVVNSYRVGLGFDPIGDKKIKGDGKTPEGRYYIDRKNPKSRFFLSLGISYPNKSDLTEATSLGKTAGGNIFIHGEDSKPHFFKRDWTAGCIALRNRDIRDIYAVVDIGTPIFIRP